MIAAVAGNVLAAPYPDSGRMYRDFKDDSFFKPAPRRDEPRPKIEAATPPVVKGEVILVQGFEIHGNTLLPEERIHAILSPHQGRELDGLELHQVAEELAVAYLDAGYFAARVYLPPQAVTNFRTVARA